MADSFLEQITETFKERDRRTGYTWAVVLAWVDFAFLYWAIWNESPVLTGIGLGVMAVACGLAVYFG